MKIKKTFFLKGAIALVGAVVLAVCIVIVVQMVKEGFSPDYPMLFGIALTMLFSAIPFFIALFQGYELLRYIDKGIAFSSLSINALKKITQCAVTISILYVSGIPHLYSLTQSDDAPGVLLMGMIIIFASIVIAIFAAVLQKLAANAIELQSENDLTV